MMLPGITPLEGSVLEGGGIRDYLRFANLPSIMLYISSEGISLVVRDCKPLINLSYCLSPS